MLNFPANVRNPKLYASYLGLLKKVVDDNQELLDEIWKLKNSRSSFDFNQSFKDAIKNLPASIQGIDNVFVNKILTDEDLTLKKIVDYLVDGRYHRIKDLKEYVECVKLISSDQVIGEHVNKSLSILNSHQYVYPWIYLSHFLKSSLFHYLGKHQVDVERFNTYLRDLESFFYEQCIDYVDISPLHHFQIYELSSGGELRKIQCSIRLSQYLHITALTEKNRLRLWNKFPVSRLDDPNDRIDYLLECKYKVRKGLDVRGEIQGGALNTEENFTTIVTLFRLLGINCGIQDILTISDSDLPIFHMGLNLFVASLDVAYPMLTYLDESKLYQFMHLWTRFGNLLVMKVLNGKRFEDDPLGNLKISLNRFNISFERKHGIDQFIDNVVGIEALFSSRYDNFRRDKTERLSKRLAIFLETDSSNREKLFCEMINLYRQRNEIIHGGYTEKYDIVKTRDFLSRSLLKYFNFLERDDFSHATFIKVLDLELPAIVKKYNNCL